MADTFEPYEGTDPYIFISYGRKDKDRVFPLLDALHDRGYRIWRDEGGIPWGVRWMETIEDHIERAEVCLVFWSEASAASEHCEAETAEMVAERKTIVTVFLDDTPVRKGLRMYLRRFQAVKLSDFDSDAAFVARLDRERVFAPCKAAPEMETPIVTAPPIAPAPKIETRPVTVPEEAPTPPAPPPVSAPKIELPSAPRIPANAWKRADKIQWYLDGDGVLTIAKNEDLSSDGPVPMPDYTSDWKHGSTAPWMPSREKIRSVVIRDDIDTIGSCAFKRCMGLTNVMIGDSVTTIGDNAFKDCTGLTSMTIPDSVTTIGKSAFDGCEGLTSVMIPGSVTTIGNWAFDGCTGLTAIHVDRANRAYSSRDGVLYDWEGTILVRYPARRAGKTYVIPDSVTTIGDSAFWCCEGLTSVTIPDSVTSISDYAFCGCAGLTSVTIPDSVTSIGDSAFDGCEGLTSVTIPDSVTSISDYAFCGCAGLTSVTIPDSVTDIGYKAFDGCTGLTAIHVDRANCAYSSRDGVLFDREGTTLVRYPIGRAGKIYAIPNSVTSIDNWAFSGCAGLTSVTIGDSVTTIGEGAFCGCAGLTSVTIGDSVTTIGDSAFDGCAGLTSVTIPDSVTYIGDGAFYGCAGLTSVTISDSVTDIGNWVFNGCASLKSVTIPAGVRLGIGAFPDHVQITRR